MKFFKHWSIATKLFLNNVLLLLMIGGVLATVVFAFRNIEQMMTRIVGRDVSQVLANAQTGRDLTGIFARTNDVVAGFLAQDDVLQTGGERLLKTTTALLAHNAGTPLEPALEEYLRQLQALLTQAATIKRLTQEIETIHTQFDANFKDLADVIARTVVMVTMEGRDVSALEHSNLDIPWYQMTLLRVKGLMDRFVREHLRLVASDDDHHADIQPIMALLDELEVRLRPLTKTEPDVQTLGQQIMETVKGYHKTITEFHAGLLRFQEQFRTLNAAQQQVLTVMGVTDTQIAATTGNMQGQITSVMRSSRILVLALCVVMLIVMVLGWVNMRRMLAPLTPLTRVANALASGDLTQEIPDARSHDEIGQLLSAMREMMDVKLTEVVINVKVAADEVAQKSQEMNSAAEQMSAGASQQAAATEEVSASMQEMAASIRQSADNAKLTESMAFQSAEDARAGKQAVTEIIQAMEVIAERISVVQEIASQTNMLSLNATIEAAKAQEYGKGFSVVAASVRDLAHASRSASEEIRAMVHSCVLLSAQAGEVLHRLVPNSEKTAELVQEIRAASQEQSTSVEHVNQAVQQLDTVTQQNAATAEQLAATAETLTTRAEELQHTTAFFTVNVTKHVEQTQEGDLLQRLQDLEQQLADLRGTALASSSSAMRVLSADHTSPTKPATPDAVSHPHGIELKIGRNDGEKDEHDNEFERY